MNILISHICSQCIGKIIELDTSQIYYVQLTPAYEVKTCIKRSHCKKYL